MLPTWSDRAKKAVSLFFRKWNDIDIYVEDRSFCTLKIYNEILDTKADKVFMSGSGSTLVGIYPTVKIMKKGIRSLKKIGYRVKQVKIIK